MRSSWFTCSLENSTKQVLYKTLFLESLTITVAILGAIVSGDSPELHFREEGFITYVSCLQLGIALVISWQIYRITKQASKKTITKSSSFWLISTFGLLFLALDDAFEIHEQIDFWWHDLFNIRETPLTDLADDMIVGGYLLLFLIYILTQWQTIKLFESSFIFFKVGFILTLGMIVLDIASNNNLLVSWVLEDSDEIKLTRQWLGALEDSAKILAEGMIIIGLYHCRQIVEQQLKKQ